MVQPEDISDKNPEGRYLRQVLFAPIGEEGQERLAKSKVLLIGCGALGSVLAEMMVRAGVGELRIVDRDFLELSNLQRQMLYDEEDLAGNLPKAEAAGRKLRNINHEVNVTPIVADANHESIEYFLESVDLILDGTDNLQTRFLINDAAVKNSLPWIYSAALAARGMVLVILPGGKPCLRCLIETPPELGQMETCETAGIIGPVVGMVGSFAGGEALKLLTGNVKAVNRNFVSFDLWENKLRQTMMEMAGEECPCCGERNFEFLEGKGGLSTISLCGRNSVQVRPRQYGEKIDLAGLGKRLEGIGPVTQNEFMVRFKVNEMEITIFPDGRAIIKGINNIDEARSLYARYVGH